MARNKEQGNKKAQMPRDAQLGVIEEQTRKWIDEFLVSVAGQSSKKTYSDSLNVFFRFTSFDKKPLYDFTLPDISLFIDSFVKFNYSYDTINNYLNAVISLRDYMKNNYKELFGPEFLYQMENMRFERDIKRIPHFDLFTLGQIRKYVLQKDIAWKYVFEIAIQLGINRNEVDICLPEYANHEMHAFISDKGKKSYEGTSLQEIIDEYQSTKNPKQVSLNNCNDRINEISDELNRQGIYGGRINYPMLKSTHNAYQFKCPNCGQSMECIDDNWVLAKTENDTHFRLVCAKCKGQSGNRKEIHT